MDLERAKEILAGADPIDDQINVSAEDFIKISDELLEIEEGIYYLHHALDPDPGTYNLETDWAVGPLLAEWHVGSNSATITYL